MFNDTALNNIRKSLEITLTFFIILIISILLFGVAASSQAALQINATLQQNATPYQVAKSLYNFTESQYKSEVSFWHTFFNSISFLILIISLSFAWISIVTSYLVESIKKQLYLLLATTVFIALSLLGASMILSTYANYSAKMLSVIFIFAEIWFILTYIKIYLLIRKLDREHNATLNNL